MTMPSLDTESTAIVDFLQQPTSYPTTRPRAIETRETHISWVFLTGQYAYKLKKPVRFDFLDFSSCDLRRQACEAELRLNRRLSPSVYLQVLPIYRCESGAFRLGTNGDAPGEVVDWLVKMRQLDDNRTLDALLRQPETNIDFDAQIRGVAAHLARFYTAQAPMMVRVSDFRQNLRRHIDENERDLLAIVAQEAEASSIGLVQSAQKRFLVTHQSLFDNRVRDGRIVDGHGDLRPEHIYLNHPPLVIDCVEFNAEYRTNDIVDELAFLAMECDLLGHPSVGSMLFEAYARASSDSPPTALIAFYKAYRACVRAKVAALRSQQLRSRSADCALRTERQYLNLAAQYVRQFGPRMVVIVGGLMGSGKSTLAHQLAELLSAEVVSSDVLRQLAAKDLPERVARATYGQGKYAMAARLENYRALMGQADTAWARNPTVILDATFSNHEMRDLAVHFADVSQAALLQVECVCPREVALQRIADRALAGGSASEAQPEHYDAQAAESQPPLPSVPLVHVDTTLALARQAAIVLEQIQTLVHTSHPIHL